MSKYCENCGVTSESTLCTHCFQLYQKLSNIVVHSPPKNDNFQQPQSYLPSSNINQPPQNFPNSTNQTPQFQQHTSQPPQYPTSSNPQPPSGIPPVGISVQCYYCGEEGF
jgi:hypothetical protein